MTRRRSILLAIVAGIAGCLPFARASDMAYATFSAIKAPDCIADASMSFFAEDISRLEVLPTDRFFLVARYMGANAVSEMPASDLSRFPDDYGWAPLRGQAVTGLSVPDPRSLWQRAGRADATLDNASAFALHCYDASSFINTWTFADEEVVGGGPHMIYGVTFSQPPPVFDANPATDFVLQAAFEVPWFAQWPDRSDQALYDPIGQVSLFAYFRDGATGKYFSLLLGVFDSRAGADGTYAPYVAHDTFTPFASTPLKGITAYGSQSPYSATYTGTTWAGLRFFRGHVSQDNFRAALSGINAYCRVHPGDSNCAPDLTLGTAFSGNPANYTLADFGVVHEVFRGGPMGNLSMGVHVSGLGAWNAR